MSPQEISWVRSRDRVLRTLWLVAGKRYSILYFLATDTTMTTTPARQGRPFKRNLPQEMSVPNHTARTEFLFLLWITSHPMDHKYSDNYYIADS